jgi:pyruvate dehydrogenase E2 component (dihydrolipoamide acetyltransferase)
MIIENSLVAESDKPQAASNESQALNRETQASSIKQQEASNESQATSIKPQEVKTEVVKDEVIHQPATNNPPLTTSIYEFKIPALGENITSASITKVLVKPGDKVEADQIVLEIETDKATVEVPTEVGGVVKDVKVKDGDKVSVGAIAFTLELRIDNGELRITETKPQISQNIQPTTNNEPLSTNKAPFQKVEHTHSPTVVTIPKDISKVVVPAAPSVRRFAREIGVDIRQVSASGPRGRITFDDIKAYAKALNEKIQAGGFTSGGIGIAREKLPDFSKWGEVEHQPMSNIRRKTAEHLSYAWSSIPHVTQFDKADITELEELRKQFSKKTEEAGGKLTVTAILLKVIASGLKVFPQFNTSVDLEKSEVIYKKYVNIGIAVDTDRGLLVPVIRDADKKNIIQLSKELQEVSKKARDKKLSLEDMQGGCFTISNLGGIGGTYFTPIINSPEVAILGVSRSAYEPVFINGKPDDGTGKFEPHLMMPLSLSYDHRIIDGADAIRFLRWVINALENPFLLSLEG